MLSTLSSPITSRCDIFTKSSSLPLLGNGVSCERTSSAANAARKKSFKRWIRQLKDLPWLKELSIEIQENDEGKWIEIHLNETTDEREDGIAEEENEED